MTESENRWFLSSPAVAEYLRITGRGPVGRGPEFNAAARDVEFACQSARFIRPDPGQGIDLYRAGIDTPRGRVLVDLEVCPPRRGYPLPQLVRVRVKRKPR